MLQFGAFTCASGGSRSVAVTEINCSSGRIDASHSNGVSVVYCLFVMMESRTGAAPPKRSVKAGWGIQFSLKFSYLNVLLHGIQYELMGNEPIEQVKWH